MNRKTILASLALATLASPAARSDDVAAERTRLANDRIRAAEELRITRQRLMNSLVIPKAYGDSFRIERSAAFRQQMRMQVQLNVVSASDRVLQLGFDLSDLIFSAINDGGFLSRDNKVFNTN